MLLALRWFLRAFAVLAAMFAVAIGVVYYLASRSLPEYSGTFRVAGLNGPVEIVRDSHNVPHIFGETDEDVFYGLGFAHAQDRLWQMSVLRRTAQGRLSEVFGRRTLGADELLRHLDIYGLAVASVESQDDETIAALESYSNGVNAWIEIVNKEGFGRGAPEFYLFEAEVRPWTPADSLAIMNLQALQLSTHLEDEVLRTRVAARVGPDRLLDLMPDEPDSRAIQPSGARALPVFSGPGAVANASNRHPLPYIFGRRDLGGASNAWAIAPEKTASGGAILANDPHLEFSAPSIWMLARLELSTGGVIGGTVPGMPAVFVGRSPNLGWALTYAYIDSQDLYFEQLDPSSSDRYLTPDGYQEFRSRISVINVKDEPPVSLVLRWTENGPVIPKEYYGIESILPEGYVMSLAWTMLNPRNTSMSAAIGLMKSSSIDSAIESGRPFKAPGMNLTLATRNEIAMQTVGSVPRRQIFHETKGRVPSPGWKYRNRWQGELAYEQLPRIRNPETGVVANTNDRITTDEFPEHLSFLWGDNQRIQRLRNLFDSRDVHTKESAVQTQLDTVSYTARALVPLLARELWHTIGTAPEDSKSAIRQEALGRLNRWTGDMNEFRPEPLIYSAWIRSVHGLLAKDELGTLFEEFKRPDPVFIERVFLDIGGAAAWCDIKHSAGMESCDEISLLALDEALSTLRSAYGSNIDNWRWGDAHQAAHDHTVLGGVPILSWFFNIRQSTSGGDNTLNVGRTSGDDESPYMNVHGAGYRGVYDFSEPDSSLFVIATGQSGHPLSRHYEDLGQLWRRGEYIGMTLDPELARAAPVGITVLEPSTE